MFTNNKFAKMDSIANLVKNILEADTKAKMEELKGNQHKIDKNKNNKIDAHDFAILRGQKKGMKEEAEQVDEMDKSQPSSSRGAEGHPVGKVAKPISYDKAKKDAYGALKTSLNKKYQKVKEEAEQVDEAQSHQAKTTMKHIKNPTQGEIEASKHMKSGTAGYADRIAMLKSAEARGALKKEEAEQVDEARVKGHGYDKPENERKAPEGKVPMTSLMPGHSEKAARLMAVQAKGRLVKGKAQSAPQKEPGMKKEEIDPNKTTTDTLKGREKTSSNTFLSKKVTMDVPDNVKEEVKQIDELKISTLARYATKANQALIGGDRSKEDKRIKGIKTAQYKILKQRANKIKEEVEQIDELKHDTLSKYQKAASKSVAYGGVDYKKDPNKFMKRLKGYMTAHDKINKKLAIKKAEQVDERTMSAPETAEKERIVKGMKKSLAGFKSRYGEKAKSVMYATATARAKEKK
jgi:hypothetical protein